jgi:nicotinamidase-related amidase
VANDDLHGNVPDKCSAALLLIDVINDLEFPEGPQIFDRALAMSKRIAALKQRAKRAKIPAVYVNDNFGRWQSDLNKLVKHCLEDGVRGQPLAEILKPDEDDYFVLKPKHSGFYSTTLDILLDYLQVQRLIVTGLAGNLCVLYTANDAYMRDYELFVPRDCCASNTPEDNKYALTQMERFLKADTRESDQLDLEKLRDRSSKQ